MSASRGNRQPLEHLRQDRIQKTPLVRRLHQRQPGDPQPAADSCSRWWTHGFRHDREASWKTSSLAFLERTQVLFVVLLFSFMLYATFFDAQRLFPSSPWVRRRPLLLRLAISPHPAKNELIGNAPTGGSHPVRVQSMTTTDTLDARATARQTIELAEAGCEIVRITAPSVRAAEALAPIAREVRESGFDLPLVADIHFLPQAALEAVKHVDKVRINPGNYADRKKFQVREYSDSQYGEELERLHDSFSPLVLRCKELGRSMRIGTNHGSLSDRIMNRFGDTPRGMAESALEFVRIAREHNFHEIVLSMKASNPKVMIEAYRLVVALMNDEDMDYPLHLGVTEAGMEKMPESRAPSGSVLCSTDWEIPSGSPSPRIPWRKFP